jgi:hypothetical protein
MHLRFTNRVMPAALVRLSRYKPELPAIQPDYLTLYRVTNTSGRVVYGVYGSGPLEP